MFMDIPTLSILIDVMNPSKVSVIPIHFSVAMALVASHAGRFRSALLI